MKYAAVLLTAIACALPLATLHAQTDASDTWKDIKLGPMFEAGGAVNAGNVASGSKTNFEFAWDAGANAIFPLLQTVAIDAQLGYDARSIEFYKQDDQNYKFSYTFNYFSIRPGIMLGDFMLGIGLGVPLGYSYDEQAGAGQPTKSFSVGATAMNLLLELRLGASIPLLETSSGDLRFMIEGTYAFNNIVSNGPLPYFDPKASPSTSSNNGPLATLQLGFSYLFDLNPR